MNPRSASLLFLTILGLALASFDLNPLQAAAPAKKAPPDTRILISKVDVPNEQVVFIYKRTKKLQTYKVDQLTAVTVSGVPGGIKDITVGLQVTDYVERDGDTLDKITVDTPDAPPVAK